MGLFILFIYCIFDSTTYKIHYAKPPGVEGVTTTVERVILQLYVVADFDKLLPKIHLDQLLFLGL